MAGLGLATIISYNVGFLERVNGIPQLGLVFVLLSGPAEEGPGPAEEGNSSRGNGL